MHKGGPTSSPLRDCGEQQTMDHIIDSCPITKLDGGLVSLHEADDDAISWLKTTVTKALAKRTATVNTQPSFRHHAPLIRLRHVAL